jgi:hypothetical protein
MFNNSTIVALKPNKSILKKRVQISTPVDGPKDQYYEGGDKDLNTSATVQNFHNPN